jgi:hypothetical protein
MPVAVTLAPCSMDSVFSISRRSFRDFQLAHSANGEIGAPRLAALRTRSLGVEATVDFVRYHFYQFDVGVQRLFDVDVTLFALALPEIENRVKG